jgi:epoxyqueuosine reductase
MDGTSGGASTGTLLLILSDCAFALAIRLPHRPQKLLSSGFLAPQFQQNISPKFSLHRLDEVQQLCFACLRDLNTASGTFAGDNEHGVFPASKVDLKALVAELAPGFGFDLAGVARIEDFPELRRFESWIEEERAGEMSYLAKTNEEGKLKRAAVENAAPWAKSAIVIATNFNSAAPFSTDEHSPLAGWISRYAWFTNHDGQRNTDYHDVLLSRLRRLEAELRSRWNQPIRTWCYVDTGPLIERVLAKYAGIGWIAKNTCVINEKIGSYIFLGVMLTSIELLGHTNLPAADRCGSCTRCIEACPTHAITAPYELDPRKCIAYLTIEKRGEVPQEFRTGIGRHIFGCDICQDVCPWNGSITGQRPPATSIPEFTPRPELINPALHHLAKLTPESFNEMFRHSPVKRTRYEGFMRNVAIALGNSGEPQARAALEHLSQSDSAVISDHAKWALGRLAELADPVPQK